MGDNEFLRRRPVTVDERPVGAQRRSSGRTRAPPDRPGLVGVVLVGRSRQRRGRPRVSRQRRRGAPRGTAPVHHQRRLAPDGRHREREHGAEHEAERPRFHHRQRPVRPRRRPRGDGRRHRRDGGGNRLPDVQRPGRRDRLRARRQRSPGTDHPSGALLGRGGRELVRQGRPRPRRRRRELRGASELSRAQRRLHHEGRQRGDEPALRPGPRAERAGPGGVGDRHRRDPRPVAGLGPPPARRTRHGHGSTGNARARDAVRGGGAGTGDPRPGGLGNTGTTRAGGLNRFGTPIVLFGQPKQTDTGSVFRTDRVQRRDQRSPLRYTPDVSWLTC